MLYECVSDISATWLLHCKVSVRTEQPHVSPTSGQHCCLLILLSRAELCMQTGEGHLEERSVIIIINIKDWTL